LKRQYILDRLLDRAELRGEPLPCQPILELAADRRILIENHAGITECGREIIRVRTNYGQLCITGRRMIMNQITGSQLVISGCIDCINVIRREK
jgi:sporulation protein YqfC